MPYDEDKQLDCPYGEENCNQDDFESMCDGCKGDRAESRGDMENDQD